MNFREIAEMFLKSEEVGQRLAGMFEFTESVDDWNSRVGGHLLNHRVTEGPKHNEIDPALKIVRDVIQRFAGVEAACRLINKKCAAPKTVHARFKGQARAQRGLFKKHYHLLARQNLA